MSLTWVIGSSGLVGQAVWRRGVAWGQDLRRHPITWQGSDAEQLAGLSAGLRAMSSESAGDGWDLIWVAGAGVIGTPVETLESETRVLTAFLELVARSARSGNGPRAVFVASSAGGVYAGGAAPPFTEHSAVAPLAPYGHQKLAIEAAVTAFARAVSVPTVIGRLTNVYGPGQDLGKAQGLVSQLAKAAVQRKPVSLYVSLDTIRDYVFVDDAAAVVLAAVDDAARGLGRGTSDGDPVIKIIGSGAPVTIAALLGEFTRVMRRRPPVVLGDSPNRRFQVRDLRMRSVTWTHLNTHVSTTLPTGIAATVEDLSRQFRRGQLQGQDRLIV